MQEYAAHLEQAGASKHSVQVAPATGQKVGQHTQPTRHSIWELEGEVMLQYGGVQQWHYSFLPGAPVLLLMRLLWMWGITPPPAMVACDMHNSRIQGHVTRLSNTCKTLAVERATDMLTCLPRKCSVLQGGNKGKRPKENMQDAVIGKPMYGSKCPLRAGRQQVSC